MPQQLMNAAVLICRPFQWCSGKAVHWSVSFIQANRVLSIQISTFSHLVYHPLSPTFFKMLF